MTNIIPIDQTNQAAALEFLERFEESCQFIIGNLTQYGPTLGEHRSSANFKCLMDGNTMVGVFCLSRRGALMVQQITQKSQLILDACAAEPIELKSFVGDWDSIAPAYKLFKQANPSYAPNFESKEILFRYVLRHDDAKLKRDPRARCLTESDYDAWAPLHNAYIAELKLPHDATPEQAKAGFMNNVKQQTIWGLFEHEQLVSTAHLNANSDTLGQIGGVFTPETHRRRGLSKATLFHALHDCLHVHRHQKSILFTGEEDRSAWKLYDAMGYERIGHFALILG